VKRTPEQIARDVALGKWIEAQLARHLPDVFVANPDGLGADWELPVCRIEVKTKLQPLSDAWDVPDVEHHVVVDELSFRRSVHQGGPTWWVIHDVTTGKWHLAHICVLACLPRHRRIRNGRGKLLFDLRDIPSYPVSKLWAQIRKEMEEKPWQHPGAVGNQRPPQA
jgi:hypothetical protein